MRHFIVPSFFPNDPCSPNYDLSINITLQHTSRRIEVILISPSHTEKEADGRIPKCVFLLFFFSLPVCAFDVPSAVKLEMVKT